MRLYKSYNFIDKDPVIDTLRNMIDGSKKSYGKIHAESDVSITTLRGWFHGKTKRPQFATVAAVVRSLGYEVKVGGHYVRPLKVVKQKQAASSRSRKRKVG
jgi:hypothetical protein